MPYDHSWDCTHQPGPQPLWQESDCYWFYDRKMGVGGYHRIGQFPNHGVAQVLLFLFLRGKTRFRRVWEGAAVEARRTPTGQSVGTHSAETFGDGIMRFRWAEPGCSADLRFSDAFYEPRNWVKAEQDEAGAAAVSSSMNADGHLEVSGRIRGTVEIDDIRLTIDALAHRDRSWGVRNYRMAHQHRMVTGTVGPDLSWATYIMHLDNGVQAKAGFVARGSGTTDVRDVETLVEFDYDGLTVSGQRTRLTLTNGTQVEIVGPAFEGCTFQTQDWLVSSHHFIDLPGGGFSILDTTNRPSKGSYLPQPEEVQAACHVNGLSSAGAYNRYRWLPAS